MHFYQVKTNLSVNDFFFFQKNSLRTKSTTLLVPQLEDTRFAMNLLDLNEKCVMVIFSHLIERDLVNMCEISSLWYKCAKRYFEIHHGAFLRSTESLWNDATHLNRSIQYFGRTATKLEANADKWKNVKDSMEFFEWIAKYCGTNIERLVLCNFKIDLEKCSNSEATSNISRLMGQLKDFEFRDGHLFNSSLLFQSCSSTVRRLKIQLSRMDENTKSGILQSFPCLSYVNVSYYGDFDYSQLLELNPTVQDVVLRVYQMGHEIIPVAGRIPNLLGLVIHAQRMSLGASPLDNIGNLERFHLSCFEADDAIIQKLADNHSKSLKWLKLDDVRVNSDFINQLGRFNDLQLLNISRLKYTNKDKCLPDEEMVRDLINALPNLRILIVNEFMHMEGIQNVCRLNTNDFKLIVFWGCAFGCRVKAIPINKMIIVISHSRYSYDSYGHSERSTRNYLNISNDFSAMCESVQKIAGEKKLADLWDQNRLFF